MLNLVKISLHWNLYLLVIKVINKSFFHLYIYIYIYIYKLTNLPVNAIYHQWLFKYNLRTIGWKLNMTRRLTDKMDYGLKEMNEMDYGLKKNNKMDYGLKEINDTMTKAEVMLGWVLMSWWNLSVMKSITEQWDDQNPNLQSIFSLGHQWCWSSRTICLTNVLFFIIFFF